MRSSWKLFKIVRRVCCSIKCRTLLHLLRQQRSQFQQVPVGSSVFGSHVGLGSAKTDSFLCPPSTATFTGVVAGPGLTQAGAPVVSGLGKVPVRFVPEPDGVKFDEGTLSLELVPCDVDGELPLMSVQFRVSGFLGALRCVRGCG